MALKVSGMSTALSTAVGTTKRTKPNRPAPFIPEARHPTTAPPGDAADDVEALEPAHVDRRLDERLLKKVAISTANLGDLTDHQTLGKQASQIGRQDRVPNLQAVLLGDLLHEQPGLIEQQPAIR